MLSPRSRASSTGPGADRFPKLNDRHDLWQVLVMLTSRKAASQTRHDRRLKRGGGQVVQASALAGEESQDVFASVSGGEPTPEFAAQVVEECNRLLNSLTDPLLRQIAVLKMEGHTNAQIAAKIERVEVEPSSGNLGSFATSGKRRFPREA